MIDWSKEFNALPDEIRTIGCAQEARVRIQQLGFEKNRLHKAYEMAVREINNSIKRNEEWLIRLEKS